MSKNCRFIFHNNTPQESEQQVMRMRPTSKIPRLLSEHPKKNKIANGQRRHPPTSLKRNTASPTPVLINTISTIKHRIYSSQWVFITSPS